MARPIIIMMRYSVLLIDNGSWVLSRKAASPGAYRAALFADRRLRERLTCLTQIVLPSLAAQSLPLDGKSRALLVMISTEMPASHADALREALAPYPWAVIVPVAPAKRIPSATIVTDYLKSIGATPGPVATARLDDDDALSKNYAERLSAHITGDNVGRAITFPLGYKASFDMRSARFTAFREASDPFTAQASPRSAIGMANA